MGHISTYFLFLFKLNHFQLFHIVILNELTHMIASFLFNHVLLLLFIISQFIFYNFKRNFTIQKAFSSNKNALYAVIYEVLLISKLLHLILSVSFIIFTFLHSLILLFRSVH